MIAPDAKQRVVGIRPGEKLHEQMIGIEDSPFTYEYDEYFKIVPAISSPEDTKSRIKDGKPVGQDFVLFQRKQFRVDAGGRSGVLD